MSSIQRWTTICNEIHHKLLAAESKRDEILAKISELPPIPPRPTPETSARESIRALKAMLENQTARQKLLRPFERSYANGEFSPGARQIVEALLYDMRHIHRSTEMLAEQLHRILPGSFDLTIFFEQALKARENIARVKYRVLRAFLEGAMQSLQCPSFRSNVSSVDDLSKVRELSRDPLSVPSWLRDEWPDIETRATKAAVHLAGPIKQYGVFERRFWRLLKEAGRVGIKMSRQSMITEFVHVEYCDWCRESRELRAYPQITSA